MIKIEKCNQGEHRLINCNACLKDSNEVDMYEIYLGTTDEITKDFYIPARILICKNCLIELFGKASLVLASEKMKETKLRSCNND